MRRNEIEGCPRLIHPASQGQHPGLGMVHGWTATGQGLRMPWAAVFNGLISCCHIVYCVHHALSITRCNKLMQGTHMCLSSVPVLGSMLGMLCTPAGWALARVLVLQKLQQQSCASKQAMGCARLVPSNPPRTTATPRPPGLALRSISPRAINAPIVAAKFVTSSIKLSDKRDAYSRSAMKSSFAQRSKCPRRLTG